jgi:hypothetical protein
MVLIKVAGIYLFKSAGKFGLWIDDNLEKGTSAISETFFNEALSEFGYIFNLRSEFKIIGLELWAVME